MWVTLPPRGPGQLEDRAGEMDTACCLWASNGPLLFFFFFLIEGRSEYAKVSNKAFPFGGRGRLVLTGRTDGVKVGPRAGGQRSPIKAVAKYAGRCHLTVTPAPTAREPLFTTARRGARAGSPALERQSPGS